MSRSKSIKFITFCDNYPRDEATARRRASYSNFPELQADHIPVSWWITGRESLEPPGYKTFQI